MRYDSQHKDETRQRVVKAAAKAMRSEGPFRIGVAGVMADAGLTHGGFYAHFASKDDLIAEAVGRMFEEGGRMMARETEGLPPAEALGAYVDAYLSPRHRDARTFGCPLPFLSGDVPRLPAAARDRFAQGVTDMTDRIAARLAILGRLDPETDARSFIAEMVGALGLARACSAPGPSDAILAASRAALKSRFNLEPHRD